MTAALPHAATVWHALGDPWEQGVIRRGLAEVVLLGVTGGTLGCWVIFYQLSYSAESLAHALFPGLVLAALTGLPLLLGGAIGIVVAAGAVAVAGRTPVVGRDTAVAVVVTGLFGLGVLLALSATTPPGIANLLFGDILGSSDGDLALAGALSLCVLIVIWRLHGRLLAVGFDRASAPSLGLAPLRVDLALLALLALAVLIAVQGLGNLLVVAILVGPAATARRLARRIVPMMAIATALAIASGIGGLYLSFYAHTAAGGSIAGVIVALYLAVEAATAARGGIAAVSA